MNYRKILLITFIAVATTFFGYFIWHKQSTKPISSKINSVLVKLPYKFKKHEAEQLSVSAFDLKNDGQYDKAIILYHKAIQIEPDNPKLYFDLAECYSRKENYRQAINTMDTAIILDSTFGGFYNNRGLYYYHNYEDKKAIKDLQKAILINGKNPSFYYNLSIVYGADKRFDLACAAFEQAKMLGLKIEKVKNQKQFIDLQNLCK